MTKIRTTGNCQDLHLDIKIQVKVHEKAFQLSKTCVLNSNDQVFHLQMYDVQKHVLLYQLPVLLPQNLSKSCIRYSKHSATLVKVSFIKR